MNEHHWRVAPATNSMEGAKQATDSDGTEDVSGFMPGEDNDFRFEFHSRTGRSANELNDLFMEREVPIEEQSNLAGAPIMSFERLGDLPRGGLANRLVAKMERQEAKEQKALRHQVEGYTSSDEENSNSKRPRKGRKRSKRS